VRRPEQTRSILPAASPARRFPAAIIAFIAAAVLLGVAAGTAEAAGGSAGEPEGSASTRPSRTAAGDPVAGALGAVAGIAGATVGHPAPSPGVVAAGGATRSAAGAGAPASEAPPPVRLQRTSPTPLSQSVPAPVPGVPAPASVERITGGRPGISTAPLGVPRQATVTRVGQLPSVLHDRGVAPAAALAGGGAGFPLAAGTARTIVSSVLRGALPTASGLLSRATATGRPLRLVVSPATRIVLPAIRPAGVALSRAATPVPRDEVIAGLLPAPLARPLPVLGPLAGAPGTAPAGISVASLLRGPASECRGCVVSASTATTSGPAKVGASGEGAPPAWQRGSASGSRVPAAAGPRARGGSPLAHVPDPGGIAASALGGAAACAGIALTLLCLLAVAMPGAVSPLSRLTEFRPAAPFALIIERPG
jgi:hypothetical protein